MPEISLREIYATYLFDGGLQFFDFSLAIVISDSRRFMPQQVLPVFKAHAFQFDIVTTN
ncbi:MAG: hypothetical protein Q7U57_18540 [Methylovulum sp.]|nr:hypothetical protein [Methylovulum sp.]